MVNILVTYASKHGATAEIAQTIARVMKTFEFEVTARRVGYIESVSEYDVLILGSALYLGDWIPEATDFLYQHQEELKNKRVWLFASGPTGEGDPLDLLDGDFISDELAPLIEIIAPREIKLFKGKIDLRRLPPEERRIVKAAKVARGDYRDWNAIGAWAEEIGRKLSMKTIDRQSEQQVIRLEE